MTQKANHEIMLGVTIIVLAAVTAFVVVPAGVVMPDNIGVLALAPNFWPLVVVAMAGLSGALIVAHGLADQRQSRHAEAAPILSDDYPVVFDAVDRPFFEALARVVAVLAALFALHFAIPSTGIVFGAFIILVFLIYLAGERRWRVILPIAVVLPLTLYVFFVYIANVPMPLGVFESIR